MLQQIGLTDISDWDGEKESKLNIAKMSNTFFLIKAVLSIYLISMQL